MGEMDNVKKRPKLPGVNVVGYPAPAPASDRTHHYVRPLEGAVRRGQAVVRACRELAKRGFVPDVICAHPGWGEALFLRDVFPRAQLVLYCEFYYHAQGTDVGFDPEYPTTFDDTLRVRVKNAASLMSLETMDAGVSPTKMAKQPISKGVSQSHRGSTKASILSSSSPARTRYSSFPAPGSR